MDDFYDLNEYLAVCIRKRKAILVIITLCVLIWSGSRVISTGISADALKGCVWGGLTGAVLSVTYVYMIFAYSKYIYKHADLQKTQLTIFGICSSGKWGKLLCKLEGHLRECADFSKIASLVIENILNKERHASSILVSGCVKKSTLEAYVALLNQAAKHYSGNIQFLCCELITTSGETLRMCKTATQVLLIEQMGQTPIYELNQEIKVFREQNVDILGVIGLE